MVILHYNIYCGFKDSRKSAGLFLDQLARIQPDVLLLNEYRESTNLDLLLREVGYSFFCINSSHGSRNRAAIFSVQEFDRVVHVSSTMRLVWVEHSGLNLISYHASPGGVEAVKNEVSEIGEILSAVDSIVLCGDLNSLSRDDCEDLGYMNHEGCEGMARYSINDRISFEPMSMFKQMGFIRNKGAGDRNTVPTKIYREHEAGLSLCLDFVLSKGVELEDVQVLRRSPFADISDHFPILFTVSS